MKSIYTVLAFLLFYQYSYTQNTYLKLNQNLIQTNDTNANQQIIKRLDTFVLSIKNNSNYESYIYPNEKLETLILIDEILNINYNKNLKDSNYYSPYLTNLVKLNDSTFIINLSYLGIDLNTPNIRASFELIAHKENNIIYFSSPLIYNTKKWQIIETSNNIFYYNYKINKKNIENFDKFIKFYDSKLKLVDESIVKKITKTYLTNNFIEVLKLIGVLYKSDYSNQRSGSLAANYKNQKLIVSGYNNPEFDNYDSHDLFHERLSQIIPRNKVNKSVDEGCAYLYGGSWGLTWNEIYSEFKKQILPQKDINWKEIKEKPIYFKTKEFNNSADYIINSLIIKQIEKEKGFKAVWELLTTGQAEKGNIKYYDKLENLIGISQSNYNEKVWELINLEK